MTSTVEFDVQSMRDSLSEAIQNPIDVSTATVVEKEVVTKKVAPVNSIESVLGLVRCTMTSMTHIYRMLSSIHAALEGVCPGAIVIPAPMSLSEQVAFLIQAKANEGITSKEILEHLNEAATKAVDSGIVLNSGIHINVAVGEIAFLDR